ncbi:MAG TPA: thioredoxin [Actinomycetota bacterium]
MDVSEANFVRDVIERSHQVPVVVDFWAEWCGPCRSLGPVLEKLAGEAGGEWVLAKVDVDANQRLASAAGVQGIPAVRAFKDGKQVAEFVGALPEPQVREWLRQLGPSAVDVELEAAARLEATGDVAGALEGYRRVLAAEPGRAEARAAIARLELAERTAGVDRAELHRRVEADPSDVESVMALADVEMSGGEVGAALDRLVALVRITAGDDRDRARKHLLSLLDTVPVDDPHALSTRKALSAALF